MLEREKRLKHRVVSRFLVLEFVAFGVLEDPRLYGRRCLLFLSLCGQQEEGTDFTRR